MWTAIYAMGDVTGRIQAETQIYTHTAADLFACLYPKNKEYDRKQAPYYYSAHRSYSTSVPNSTLIS